MRTLFVLRAIVALTLVTASACSSKLPMLPSIAEGPSASPESSIPSGYGVVRFRIAVPGRTPSRHPHRVLPAYVSSATQKVVAIVRGAKAATSTTERFRCDSVCTGKIVAPLGVDLITLQLEDKKNRVLSRGSATILVFQKKHNAFDFTLDGVPASASAIPESNLLPVVPASSGNVVFEARDADGKIVTPDGHFVDANGNPLVFTIKSNNAALHLSVNTVSAPTAPIAFSYNGTQHLGTIVLTPGARRGVRTSVTFHPATIRLVPGIASRMFAPMPIDVLTVTQVPMPASPTACGGFPCSDPNEVFVLGNSGHQQVALMYNVVTGVYTLQDFNFSAAGPFATPPIDLGGNGFYGYFAEDGTNAYGHYDVVGNSSGYGGSSSPCGADSPPIGNVTSTLFCQIFGAPNVFDITTFTIAAYGFERKMRTINGTTYIAATNETATPQAVYSYAGTTSTLISGAIGIGANVSTPTTGYYGNSDGTVSLIGGSTLATFSHPVEDVVGIGPSLFVYETGGYFGAATAAGTYETAPLSVGRVVEVIGGVGGVPILVESDGTLDVIGL